MRKRPRIVWPLPLFALAIVAAGAVVLLASDASAQGGAIRVSAIHFDHDGSEALPLRVNFSTTILKPEWVRDERSGACLFVQDRPVEILVRFEAPPWLDRAYFWAESDGPLGGVPGRMVEFTDGVSDPEFYAFTTERPAPAGLGVHTWDWQWKAARTEASAATTFIPITRTGKHRLYTILDTPGKPWRVDMVGTQNPWTEALDVALQHTDATTEKGILEDMVRFCYERPCFQYDTWWGSPCYSSVVGSTWRLNLSLLLADIRADRVPRTGCCYDGALIVLTFADLLGAKNKYLLSGQPYTPRVFGYLNAMDPIGRGQEESNNPFNSNYQVRSDPITYRDGTQSSCRRSAFSNHSFVGSQIGSAGIIWDATMASDVDSNPDTHVLFPPDGTWVSTGLTETVLTDDNASWNPGEWVGMLLNPNTNTVVPDPYVEYVIVDNTATTLTVAEGSNLLEYAAAGNHYWIRDPEAPQVDIRPLVALPWVRYEATTVDRIGSIGADPPIENNVTVY
jgi:hypothetical protein